MVLELSLKYRPCFHGISLLRKKPRIESRFWGEIHLMFTTITPTKLIYPMPDLYLKVSTREFLGIFHMYITLTPPHVWHYLDLGPAALKI